MSFFFVLSFLFFLRADEKQKDKKMNKNSKHSLTSLSLFFLSLSLDLSIHTQKNRPLEPTTKRCSGASSTGAPRPKGEFKFLCFLVFFFFSSKKET